MILKVDENGRNLMKADENRRGSRWMEADESGLDGWMEISVDTTSIQQSINQLRILAKLAMSLS